MTANHAVTMEYAAVKIHVVKEDAANHAEMKENAVIVQNYVVIIIMFSFV